MSGLPGSRPLPPVLAGIVGQPEAARLLSGSLAAPVHAYLFVGVAGSGKRDVARRFAAALLCAEHGCGRCESCRATLAAQHPDVAVVERSGASISVDDAREVGALAQRTPRSGSYSIVILNDFHLVDRAAPALLKTIEEPPDTTVFLVLAEFVPPSLVTIASRCVTVEFRPIEQSTLEAALIAEGVAPELAASAAAGADGRLDRARLLSSDPNFARRTSWWRSVPERLDGSGATVAVLLAELDEMLDELVGVARERQTSEVAELRAAAEQAGERRIVGLATIEDRHKREQRRIRTDELRAGLAALGAHYAERLAAAGMPPSRRAGLIGATGAIDGASAALVRNPGEELLLERLLLVLEDASA